MWNQEVRAKGAARGELKTLCEPGLLRAERIAFLPIPAPDEGTEE